MNERTYRKGLIKRIKERFPECTVLRNDPAYFQGIPDILILFKNTWAMLEIKTSESAVKQPNQDHHVKVFDRMSFASFINPDNEEGVLNAIQSTFSSAGKTRVSKS